MASASLELSLVQLFHNHHPRAQPIGLYPTVSNLTKREMHKIYNQSLRINKSTSSFLIMTKVDGRLWIYDNNIAVDISDTPYLSMISHPVAIYYLPDVLFINWRVI